jgi:hypothetical protein
VRALLGFVVALGVALPVVASASPASAATCSTSVSDGHPQQGETVTVSFVGPASTSATVTAHYRTVANTSTATTDANGHGSVGFAIGTAAYGETVVVDVVIGSANCSTSFTPTVPAATTTSTSTTSTTAALTGITTATTSTVATTATTAAVAVRTGTVTAAATTSALPFTGNATGLEAAMGAILLASGLIFLSSARRREELWHLIWPDDR